MSKHIKGFMFTIFFIRMTASVLLNLYAFGSWFGMLVVILVKKRKKDGQWISYHPEKTAHVLSKMCKYLQSFSKFQLWQF